MKRKKKAITKDTGFPEYLLRARTRATKYTVWIDINQKTG